MQMLFSAVMGIVQGLSEFLPISSSGHLLVFEKLLTPLGYQAQDAKGLLIMLHMGTLLAVAVVFWKDWMHMLRHPIKDVTLRLLFLASLPALLVMLLFHKFVESTFTGWFLAPAFLVTALFLFLGERLSKKSAQRKERVGDKQALVMGVFQSIALLPGVSRSGSTLLGGILSGLTRRQAAKFSFMMSAPAILGSFLMEVKDTVKAGQLAQLFAPDVLVGVAFAAVSGYLAIRFMLKLIERVSLNRFVGYLVALAAFVFVCQMTGALGFPPLY